MDPNQNQNTNPTAPTTSDPNNSQPAMTMPAANPAPSEPTTPPPMSTPVTPPADTMAVPPSTPTMPESTPTPPSTTMPPTDSTPTTPPPPDQPAASASSTPPPHADGKPLNKGIIFAVIAVIIVIILGLLYFFALSSGNKGPEVAAPMPTPTVAVTPTVEAMEQVTEDDLETLDMGSPEAALEDIEADVDSLQ